MQDKVPQLEINSAHDAIASMEKPAHSWYPLISVLEILPLARESDMGRGNRKTSDSLEAGQPATVVPATMFSIRADQPGQALPKTLAISCRTTVAIHGRGKTIPLEGVVTQEVVSSTGKILIMAGSRVTGWGRLDPENGRIKSDGLWSIFFEDHELRVQARLLDRPGGLPGLVGTDRPPESYSWQKETGNPDARFISVARNAPFILELHGEMLLRDAKSSESTN